MRVEIDCPSCSTKYALDTDLLSSKAGGSVQCSKCSTIWYFQLAKPVDIPLQGQGVSIQPPPAAPAPVLPISTPSSPPIAEATQTTPEKKKTKQKSKKKEPIKKKKGEIKKAARKNDETRKTLPKKAANKSKTNKSRLSAKKTPLPPQKRKKIHRKDVDDFAEDDFPEESFEDYPRYPQSEKNRMSHRPHASSGKVFSKPAALRRVDEEDEDEDGYTTTHQARHLYKNHPIEEDESYQDGLEDLELEDLEDTPENLHENRLYPDGYGHHDLRYKKRQTTSFPENLEREEEPKIEKKKEELESITSEEQPELEEESQEKQDNKNQGSEKSTPPEADEEDALVNMLINGKEGKSDAAEGKKDESKKTIDETPIKEEEKPKKTSQEELTDEEASSLASLFKPSLPDKEITKENSVEEKKSEGIEEKKEPAPSLVETQSEPSAPVAPPPLPQNTQEKKPDAEPEVIPAPMAATAPAMQAPTEPTPEPAPQPLATVTTPLSPALPSIEAQPATPPPTAPSISPSIPSMPEIMAPPSPLSPTFSATPALIVAPGPTHPPVMRDAKGSIILDKRVQRIRRSSLDEEGRKSSPFVIVFLLIILGVVGLGVFVDLAPQQAHKYIPESILQHIVKVIDLIKHDL